MKLKKYVLNGYCQHPELNYGDVLIIVQDKEVYSIVRLDPPEGEGETNELMRALNMEDVLQIASTYLLDNDPSVLKITIAVILLCPDFIAEKVIWPVV